MTDRSKTTTISRRNLLKGAAGVASLAAGSGTLLGAPYVHAADAKVLRYLGTAVN
ncbi:MAG: twin-arginine translocation signal domain-containing protein, partial [Bradyrhizobium sp.]